MIVWYTTCFTNVLCKKGHLCHTHYTIISPTTVHIMHYNYINNGPILGPSLAISPMIAWKKFWLANHLLTFFL